MALLKSFSGATQVAGMDVCVSWCVVGVSVDFFPADFCSLPLSTTSSFSLTRRWRANKKGVHDINEEAISGIAAINQMNVRISSHSHL